MYTLLGIVAFLYLAGTIGFVLAAYTAPYGTEDERGFRIAEPQRAAANDLPVNTRAAKPAAVDAKDATDELVCSST